MSEATACISKKISQYHSECKEEITEDKRKQIIARAYKACDASKLDFKPAEFCPYRVFSKIDFIANLKRNLYSDDFTNLPTSVLVAKAVGDCLPKLRKDFPNKSEVEILKDAYQLARMALDETDFVVESDKPIYFKISIPNEELPKFKKRLKAYAIINDFVDDNSLKIEMKDISKVKMSHELTEEDLESDKRKLFTKVAKKDIKNVPPIFIDKKNKIWDGHHRYLTLKLAGFDVIPVIQLPVSILREIEDYNDFLKGWDIKQNSNENVTQFDTELNRYLKDKGLISDFTDDKAAEKFFAPDAAVTSTTVAEIGYDAGKLRIFFKNGGGYEYPVPSSWYLEMLNSASKGAFVWDTLRGRTPGRVIDKPNKITPGGVGGSIVPYFKIKGARMPQEAMKKSVKSFLQSARKGTAEAGGVPIEKIDRPTFRQFKKFLKHAGTAQRTPSFFQKLRGIFPGGKNDFESKVVNDFTEDMHYFKGPMSRAGNFEYSSGIKSKDFENLKEVISTYNHVPSFDSHHENQILGFAYNLTTDPDVFMKDHEEYNKLKQTPYVYGEGFTFDEIENVSKIEIKENKTKLPVSFRFIDENEGKNSNKQDISKLIHLAISVDQSDQDRCSTAGGESCWVQFGKGTQDFQDMEKNMEGDNMPIEKKKKTTKKKPPTEDFDGEEEEKEEESEDKEKKEDKDFSKGSKSRKGKKKGNSDDMVTISQAVFDDMVQKQDDLKSVVSDLVKQNNLRIEAVKLKKMDDFKDGFSNPNQLYKLKKGVIKEANYEQLAVLNDMVRPYDGPVDPRKILASQTEEDFRDDLLNAQLQAENDLLPKSMQRRKK